MQVYHRVEVMPDGSLAFDRGWADDDWLDGVEHIGFNKMTDA